MILAKAPLRVTLGGGGSDLAPYVNQYGGYCIGAAIDKYVYVAVTKPFELGYYLKYSSIEKVMTLPDIQHALIKAVLEYYSVGPQIEITTLADIPSGTGLGSSSAFTVALIKAVTAFIGFDIPPDKLFELAVCIERDIAGSPVGMQDAACATYGGVRAYTFTSAEPKRLYYETLLYPFMSKTLLFSTSTRRDATAILASQGEKAYNLNDVKVQGRYMGDYLKSRDFVAASLSINKQWALKEVRCPSDDYTIRLRNHLMLNGANGVKLIGAGIGGFLLVLTDEPVRVRQAAAAWRVPEVPFKIAEEGCSVEIL